MKTLPAFASILAAAATLTACPAGTGDTFTNPTENVVTSGNGDASTTGDNTSNPTTAATATTEATTGTSGTSIDSTSTTGQDASCSVPDDVECVPEFREWCADVDSMCQGAGLNLAIGGNGTDYCSIVDGMCADGVPDCQLCFYMANTCSQVNGIDCVNLFADCLCRAAAKA